MSLAGVASETIQIAESGSYRAPSGHIVSIGEDVAASIAGTCLYRPGDFPLSCAPSSSGSPKIEVTAEKTGRAAQRLVSEEGTGHVAALNFASAKNPGGGFTGGAKAQEEDLCRCSTLYRALLTQRDYYEANRNHASLVYTDHIIYSPGVVFFRDEQLNLLERSFATSIITAPAPNAGAVLEKQPWARPAIREALKSRARFVLQVAARHGHRSLVLGAWGCGVFRNDPAEVARAFAEAIDEMVGAFDRIVFAVYERSGDGPNLRAFRECFSGH